MKRVLALLFFAVTFVVAVNAQCGDRSSLGYVLAGPCREQAARRGYASIDYAINNFGYGGYGLYPDYGWGNGRSVITGIAGFVGGYAVGRLTAPRDRREYVPSPDGGRAYYTPNYPSAQGREVHFAEPKPQKPLDCRKPSGKRGKNEQACAAVETELAARQHAAERQACLADFAASPWRLRNGSDRFTFMVTESGHPLLTCGELVVLRPLQTIRIFPPTGQIGGKSSGASASGERVEFTAKVRPVNQPGFIGFVLMAPGAEGGN